jgi:hypothetical protein
MSNPEDNIEDNKANCEGCPKLKDCPIWVAAGSKDCKERLQEDWQ